MALCGGRFLSDRGSGSLKPWATKFDVDFPSPWLFLIRIIQSISSTEFKLYEDHVWSIDFSVRIGLRWSNARAPNRPLSLKLECFKDEARSNLVYRREIAYVRLGLHYSW